MLKKGTTLVSILLLTALSGCGTYRFFEVKDKNLIEVSNDVTEELIERSTRTIPKNSLILVSTLLNVNDLHETSALGRIISDQIASAFHNAGYRIIGMEMPIDLFMMKEGGTLHLSDEIKAIIKPYNPSVIVGGVYAAGKRNSYLSLRIVDLYTKNIISSTDVSIPMGPDARKMVMSEKIKPSASTENAAKTDENGATATENLSPAEENPKPADETVESYQR